MIRVECEQGDHTWIFSRLGIPTASRFDEIITAVKGEFSKSADRYAHELIAEQILRAPMDSGASSAMLRGTSMEVESIGYYELVNDVDTEKVGFVLRDDRRAGCSPDRLVGANGMLEAKCPTAAVHISYLLDKDGIGYKQQCQGGLWICEREWIDTLSFHPAMPKALVRQYRDEPFITKLAAAVERFHEMLYEMKQALVKAGHFDADDLGIDAFPPLEVVRGGAHA